MRLRSPEISTGPGTAKRIKEIHTGHIGLSLLGSLVSLIESIVKCDAQDLIILKHAYLRLRE